MSRILALDGNGAVAQAMRQINPDVVAAYPITPQTSIVENFAQMVADGEVATEFITVESEHSALSACVGASAAGGRVMTATSSAGLAFMWEVLYIAASTRLPIVMPVVNRALSGPINIHCDHSDTMGARDAGWVQLFSESAQEAYENTLQAVRIAEHPDVRLPVMVMQDGFITSHGMERVEIFDDEPARKFLGEFKPHYPLLDLENPVTYGPLDFYDYYFEHKRQQVEASRHALRVVREVSDEFNRKFGRNHGILDLYRMDDAQVAVIVLSSTAGTARVVVDRLRAEGLKVGLIRPRLFRPFPHEALMEVVESLSAVAVMDRSIAFGAMRDGGPLWIETLAAAKLHNVQLPITNYVFGLGGRDVTPAHIERVYRDLYDIVETGRILEAVTYLGVRGDPQPKFEPEAEAVK
ncbi:MAG: pyruvate ferredoxin oxidoreductase [Chloroflexi bacterium]|nr:pyruvate ferredoxin oxidoreductase [Chloroflexota bacterium]